MLGSGGIVSDAEIIIEGRVVGSRVDLVGRVQVIAAITLVAAIVGLKILVF
jgi:hypothetical protein